MLKHRVVALFLTTCLSIAGALVFNVSVSHILPTPKAQTEWVMEKEVKKFQFAEENTRYVKRKFHILRWHNHTINFALRNVRSRWLTWQKPDSSLPNIQYPIEEASII